MGRKEGRKEEGGVWKGGQGSRSTPSITLIHVDLLSLTLPFIQVTISLPAVFISSSSSRCYCSRHGFAYVNTAVDVTC